MKGKFTINLCEHGRARFCVSGRINGKRIREFFRTNSEAVVACIRRNKELADFGQEMAGMPAALRAEAMACHERLAAIGVTLTQACNAYLAQHDLRSKSVSVTEAAEACLAEYERKFACQEIGWAHLKGMKKETKRLVNAFGAERVCDLTPKILTSWVANLPLATATRNYVINYLSGFFSFVVRQEWMVSNPVEKMERFSTKRREAIPPAILSPEQAANLLSTAAQTQEALLPHVAIGLFAGLRVSEISKLDWSDIDFEDKTINVRAEIAKTAQPRWVPMTDGLIAWLEPYRRSQGPVVPCSYFDAEKRLQNLRQRAGVDGLHNALRHSFCSYHLALHKNANLTAHEAGHMSTNMLFKNYNNRVKQSAAVTYFAIRPVETAALLAVA